MSDHTRLTATSDPSEPMRSTSQQLPHDGLEAHSEQGHKRRRGAGKALTDRPDDYPGVQRFDKAGSSSCADMVTRNSVYPISLFVAEGTESSATHKDFLLLDRGAYIVRDNTDLYGVPGGATTQTDAEHGIRAFLAGPEEGNTETIASAWPMEDWYGSKAFSILGNGTNVFLLTDKTTFGEHTWHLGPRQEPTGEQLEKWYAFRSRDRDGQVRAISIKSEGFAFDPDFAPDSPSSADQPFPTSESQRGMTGDWVLFD